MVKRVVVLMGGFSSERDVSLRSGSTVAGALDQAGYGVVTIDVRRDMQTLLAGIDAAKPDVIFNALHGRFSEDGSIQGFLDIMRIPYTHSGLLASALAMNKPMARNVFAANRIPIAEGRVVSKDEVLSGDVLPRPYVLKPINEGSSFGVHIITAASPEKIFDGKNWPYGNSLLAEKFIPGRELSVAVMGERVLGVVEITMDNGFYDYEAKYLPGGSRHLIPAPLPPEIYEEAMSLALRAHNVLGCRGVSRSDLRYDDTITGSLGHLVLLEVNTQPGMTATSLVPDLAAHAGISFVELVSWMVENATCDD